MDIYEKGNKNLDEIPWPITYYSNGVLALKIQSYIIVEYSNNYYISFFLLPFSDCVTIKMRDMVELV
jgi:hypothetical protein